MITNVPGSGFGALGVTDYRQTAGTARIFPIINGQDVDVGYQAGDMEALAWTVDVTKQNRFARTQVVRRKAFSYVSQVEPKVTGTFVQMGELARAIAAMSFGTPFKQAAVPLTTVTRNCRPGATLRCGGAVNVTIDPASVKSGATVIDPAGYVIDPYTGCLDFLPDFIPEGVQLNEDGIFPVTYSYKAAEFETSDLGYGLFSGGGLLCRLQVTEAVLEGQGIVPYVAEFHRLLITPTGDQTQIGDGTDGLKAVTWEAEVQALANQPVGYEYGRLYPSSFGTAPAPVA